MTEGWGSMIFKNNRTKKNEPSHNPKVHSKEVQKKKLPEPRVNVWVDTAGVGTVKKSRHLRILPKLSPTSKVFCHQYHCNLNYNGSPSKNPDIKTPLVGKMNNKSQRKTHH